MLRTMSISTRVYLSLFGLALFLVATVGGFLVGADRIRALILSEVGAMMLEAQKAKIEVATRTAADTFGQLLKDVPKEQQLDFLRKAISTFRYEQDQSGYLLVIEGTTVKAHPINAGLIGKDMGDAKDKQNVYFTREMEQKAKQGGGFVQYVFAKPGKGDQPKLSYAVYIPGTPYWIATGVYIDNIEAEKERIGSSISSVIRSNTTVVLVGVVAVLLLIVLPSTVLVVRSITRPLAQATAAAEQVADGDYAVKLDESGRDESAKLSKALNKMASTLSENIEKINIKTEEAQQKATAAEAARGEAEAAISLAEKAKSEGMLQASGRLESIVKVVGAASDQLSGQIDQSSRGAETQAHRVSETATAMEEMNATVLEVARNASQAAETADMAKRKAQDGSQIVTQAVKGIGEVQSSALELRNDMTSLGKQAEGIGNILNVISDIADQTNLLALNAAIEAARAGDAGRGFAVVADEVRKLAEKTMVATKEVGESIGAIQAGTRKSREGVDRAVERIDQTTELVSKSGDALVQIVSLVDLSSDQVRAIATASEEQSAATEEINRSIEQVSAISVETSQVMHEASRAVSELAGQAHILQNLIVDLQAEAGGGSLR